MVAIINVKKKMILFDVVLGTFSDPEKKIENGRHANDVKNSKAKANYLDNIEH